MSNANSIDTWRQYRTLAEASRHVRVLGDSIQLCEHKRVRHTAGFEMQRYCAYCGLHFVITDADVVLSPLLDFLQFDSLRIHVYREGALSWLRDMEIEMAT